MHIRALNNYSSCSTLILYGFPEGFDMWRRDLKMTVTDFCIKQIKETCSGKDVYHSLGCKVSAHSFVIASVRGSQKGAILAFRKLGFQESIQRNRKNRTVVHLFTISAPVLMKTLEKY